MCCAMTQGHPQLDPEQRKPKVLFAAGLAAVMLTISLTVAGITAWYLIVGERGNAVQNTLPSDCEWIVENHEGHLFSLLGEVSEKPEFAALPHPASAIVALLPRLREQIIAPLERAEELPLHQGIGACGRNGAVLVSLPLGDDANTSIAAVSELVEHHVGGGKWAVSDAEGRFRERVLLRSGRNVASILHTDSHAVIALTAARGDAAKAQADAVRKNREASMRASMPYREGRERVGGTERLWMDGDTARRLAARWATEEQRGFLQHAQWLAVSLRQDEQHLLLHIHVGGGQRLFDHANKRLKDEGDIALRGAARGLEAKYFVVDKGVVITARAPLAVVGTPGS